MSRLPFELLLALRYLRPKRTFVSVITLISVLGVTLGVAVLIIVISVMSGFDQQLRDKILGFNTHLKILPRGETMKDYAAVARIVAANRERQGRGAVCPGPRAGGDRARRAASRGSARPAFAASIPQIETNMSVLPEQHRGGQVRCQRPGAAGRDRIRAQHEPASRRPRRDRLAQRAQEMAGEQQEGGRARPGAAGIRGARDLRRRLLRIQPVGDRDLAAGRAGFV